MQRCRRVAEAAVDSFMDEEQGGFFFFGRDNEQLIMRPKENEDGALPSGNSVMFYVLRRLAFLLDDSRWTELATQQRRYMQSVAAAYPAGFAFYLYADLPLREIVCATKRPGGALRAALEKQLAVPAGR